MKLALFLSLAAFWLLFVGHARAQLPVDGPLAFGATSSPITTPTKYDSTNLDDTTIVFQLTEKVPDGATAECRLECDTQGSDEIMGIAYDDTQTWTDNKAACPVTFSHVNTAGSGDRDMFAIAYGWVSGSTNLVNAKITCKCTLSGGGDCVFSAPGPSPTPDDDPCCAVRIYRYIRDSSLSLYNGLFGN